MVSVDRMPDGAIGSHIPLFGEVARDLKCSQNVASEQRGCQMTWHQLHNLQTPILARGSLAVTLDE
jgi:hypothetical protein